LKVDFGRKVAGATETTDANARAMFKTLEQMMAAAVGCRFTGRMEMVLHWADGQLEKYHQGVTEYHRYSVRS
jgi:hypothetical protein